jgi:predicted transcriptional regulator of viral defense system
MTTTTNNTIENLNLTELETKVLTTLIDNLYAEAGFSDVDAKDLSNWTKIDIKSVRGAVGSLVKKGIISIYDNGEYQIIYLNNGYWDLHPEWKNETVR